MNVHLVLENLWRYSGKYGVNPDIAIYGKLGNLCDYCRIGKKNYENSKKFISSTFWSEELDMFCITDFKIGEKKKTWVKISKTGDLIKKGWQNFYKYGYDVKIQGIKSIQIFHLK